MKRLEVRWRDQVVNMSLPASGVLSAIVTIQDRSHREAEADDVLRLHLGGLDSTDGMHPHWGDYDLVPGDEVTISVHDDRASDPPLERRGLSKEDVETNKKKHLRQTAAELGWELIEHESKREHGEGGKASPATS